MLHYNLGRTSEPANGIFGAGAHTDYGLITLLATDDNYGLQVCATYIFMPCSFTIFSVDLEVSNNCRYVKTKMLSLRPGSMYHH